MIRLPRKALTVLALLYFAPSLAFAITQTWYVRTDCANNGDGGSASCAGSPGGAGAFTTLANAATGITATTPNFVTSTVTGIIDLAGSTVDTSTPVFSGITTSATYNLTLYVDTPNMHRGYIGPGYTLSNTNSAAVLYLNTKFMVVDGLQILTPSNDNTHPNIAIRFLDSSTMNGSVITIRNCLTAKTGTSTDANNYSVYFSPTASNIPAGGNWYIYNNAAYGHAKGMRCVTSFGVSCRFYNNTIRSTAGVALELFRFEVNSSIRVKNNLLQSCGGSCYSLTGTDGTVTTATNNTSDNTSPDGASYRSQTSIFGPQVIDFRLAGADTASYNRGSDLSADAFLAFSTDFIRTARPQSTSWDIGANERIGTGPGPLTTGGLSLLMGTGM